MVGKHRKRSLRLKDHIASTLDNKASVAILLALAGNETPSVDTIWSLPLRKKWGQ